MVVKKCLLAVIVIILLGVTLLFGCRESTKPEPVPEPTPEPQLTLDKYPEMFKTTMIIVGEGASEIELESAKAVAMELKESTGNEPTIKSGGMLTEEDKATHNLIIVGTPGSNNILPAVYELTDATRVTEEYPGENKGILEIMRNPWNSDKALLIVAGSDEWGVKAAVLTLELARRWNKVSVTADWRHLTKQAAYLGLTPSEFITVSTSVWEYLYQEYPFLHQTDFSISYERVKDEIEGVPPEAIVIEAYANFRTPPVIITVALYQGKADIILKRIPKDDA